MSTIVAVGTGPSLTMDQVQVAREKGFRLFGCNRVFEVVPDLEVLYGCNHEFWAHYWDRLLSAHAAKKWTTNSKTAKRYNINHIAEQWGYGLCETPGTIHHGHGSGFSLVSLAHELGATRVLLLGYDLKYAPDYDGERKEIGSSPRHYFGEYPAAMQHWPSKRVDDGVHSELVELYRQVHEQGLVEIISCSPGSALEGVIPHADINEVLEDL